MRIIGCGNTDRGDDAAGILVARRLAELGLDSIEHSGDGFALLELWHGADDVVLVDAIVSGAPPGTISPWDAGADPIKSQHCRCSTHVFGPAEAIEIARAVGRLPERIRIIGIEAVQFEPGSEPVPDVMQAVEDVVRELYEQSKARAEGCCVADSSPCN
ncbi:MAG TPA: hydrogenase maturation protease [Bryobacteraceae bacterium]|nr:hydrogenase maturation protease [Bryobacteraceae bacterium]